ncbi:MAG TPA: endo alpha-1,4 polygalactosaminidase [Rickettsiales bacterium]|nr:endo alpha-1,4 polygalactosaminidase [Rickettsiales bacterium]
MAEKYAIAALSALVLAALPSLGFADEQEWYRPQAAAKWQIQLDGKVNPSYPVEIYDIDLFDASDELIHKLHDSGKRVVCYFSAGSSEKWREDFSRFRPSDMGKPLKGWAGEKWLDVRSQNVREIMESRMDLAVQKGCDGIDPDNVDGYTNKPGLPFTAEDQLNYNRFLAQQGHKRHLAVGLKNDMGQAEALADDFDFSVNEQCFEYDECDKLEPFIERNKPVLNIEYKSPYVKDVKERRKLCKQSRNMKFSTLILPLKLNDKFRYSCLED